LKGDLESIRTTAKSLISAGRPFEAVHQAHLAHSDENPIPSDFIASLLESALLAKGSDLDLLGPDVSYPIQRFIERLQKDATIDRVRLARIEWGYLPMLDRSYSPTGPNTLIAAVTSEPQFFVDILKLLYRGKSESRQTEPASEQDQSRAQHAFRLLDKLDVLPGASPDGTIDCGVLAVWLNKVRALANECDRAEICDQTLGQIIARAFKEVVKEPKVPQEVATLLEQIGSEELFRGFVNGAINSRGVVTRRWQDGGKREREIAER
jgi:hypothetical protein